MLGISVVILGQQPLAGKMKFHPRISGILIEAVPVATALCSLVASAGGSEVSLFQSHLLLTSFAGNAHHLKKEKKAHILILLHSLNTGTIKTGTKSPL